MQRQQASRRPACVQQHATRGNAISNFVWIVVFTLVTGFGLTSYRPAHGAATDKPNAKPGYAQGHILVAPKASTNDTDFQKGLGKRGMRSLGKVGKLNVHVVDVTPGDEEATVARLRADPDIEFAEVDQLMPAAGAANDPSFASAWHLPRIGAPTAWDYATGSGVIIAILDTGVDASHPDLAPNMVAGWNFYDNNSNTADVHGHGTTVAGAAAAATNNGVGVASVAGSARIMPLRITDPNAWASWSAAAQALNWAADHGARVANISYVGASSSSTIQTAANYFRSKGGVVFVAAGNTGAIDNTAPTSSMMVVAATQENDQLASFSTFGSFVGIAAPGNNILSTTSGGGYQYCWGTSLATPVVAGAAALIISRRPDFTAAQVDAALKSTAADLGSSGTDIYFGAGRLDVAAALTQVANATTPADTTAPTVAIASPLSGTVSGTVTFSVNASDNVGVSRVELRVNGSAVSSDTSAPYQLTWDSRTVADGGVSVTAAAYDAAGNVRVSSAVSLTVRNATAVDTTAPSVSIASPTGGTVSGSVTVSVNASDNVGVARVDFRVNGTVIATSNAAPFTFAWDTSAAQNGPVLLSAVAYDTAGNVRTSSTVTVNVGNSLAPPASDATAPSITLSNPVNGSYVNANVPIKATASDNAGSSGITLKLFIDGSLMTTVKGSSLSYSWNAKKASPGDHTILVTATDAAGNSSTQQVVVRKK